MTVEKHYYTTLSMHIGPGHEKICLWEFANNTGADQPAHLRSLISTFFYLLFGKYHI